MGQAFQDNRNLNAALDRIGRLEGILESYLVDHLWRVREAGQAHRCECPACLSARDALGKP